MAALPVAAIVGSETLLGREVRDLLAEQSAVPDIRMLAEEEGGTILSEVDDEPAIIIPLEEENLAGAAVAFLAGSRASALRALEIAAAMAVPPVLVDLTHALEDNPRARLRAPMLEPEHYGVPHGTIHVTAHPAAIALALFYERLHRKFTVRQSVAHVLEPASERGQRGIEELQQQTISLLSFKNVPKRIFDAQIGFNVLPRYGTEAPRKLEEFETRIDRHLATLLGTWNTPMPSLRLIQAPVFHGYSCSIWTEFDGQPGISELCEALASAQAEIRTSEQEPPTNVGSTGVSGITIGAIEPDRNNPRARWFWLVADNLRIAAENAIAAARPALEAAAR